MKQLLVDLQDGEIRVEDVPIPIIKKGMIVETRYSLISAGTESSLLDLAKKSLIGKAKERPDLAQKIINKAKKDGIFSAYEQAMSRLSKPEPLGYSCAGIVVKTNIDDFKIGDRVACAGAGFANHAEYNFIPKNLCVKIPDNVSFKEACFTTVGAIAMQGVRNSKVSVGEIVVVIGLGLIGLLTIQILKAAGCIVLGVDIDEQKNMLALELGANAVSGNKIAKEKLNSLSGFGADAVIITAATESNAPIELAGELIRDHGRIVIVGNVGMDIPRPNFYEKEVETIVSRSYGLGRYDRAFEEMGIDYPIYVRWTEKGNMEAFLNLISEKKINIEKIISHEYSINDAINAYELIIHKEKKFIGVVLKYVEKEKLEDLRVFTKYNFSRPSIANIGFIGAGIHASSSLLPYLSKMNVNLIGIANATGLSSKSIANKYKFRYCTTDYIELLKDTDINFIFITTRNNLHSKILIESIKAGKNVFVEKPLATDIDQLREIVRAYPKGTGKIMVGFNRRYSLLTHQIKEFFSNRESPMIINYRVNLASLKKDHWVHDSEQGTGMAITECCHFIDLISYLTGSNPTKVYAQSIRTKGNIKATDNFQMILSLNDGSIGTITYSSIGDDSYSKEQIEVFCEGSVGVINDFRNLKLIRRGKITSKNEWLRSDKGFKNELSTFLNIENEYNDKEFTSYIYTTLTTFKLMESIFNEAPMDICLEQI